MSSERNKRLYEQERDDLWRRQLSASENLDKTIIFTSLPLLGISLVFLKDIVPEKQIVHVWILIISWISFVFAILCVISSYWTSMWAASKLDPQVKDYYLKGGRRPYSRYDTATRFLNYFSSIFYLVAIILSVVFFGFNLLK